MTADQHDPRAALARWNTFQEAMAQPEIWRGWAAELAGQAADIAGWVRARACSEVWFCGAGTSSFIGDTLAVHLNAVAGRSRFRAIPTTDLVSCPKNYLRTEDRILVVSFGRSGDSSETIGTLDLLDAHFPSADRLNITCNPKGALALRASPGPGQQRVVVLPSRTNDSGFAMTSSYSTMLLTALACLDLHPPLPLARAMGALATAAEDVLDAALRVATTGPQHPSRVVFLGCGALTGAARESALKVLELTRGQIPTAWDTTLGFRHGPKAVVDDATRVHVYLSGDPHTRRYDLDAAHEIRRQFGTSSVLVIGSGHDGIGLEVPLIGNDAWTSVLHVLTAQIHAIVWSEALQVNVDSPFAAGTLTRVVDGVKLYRLESLA